MRLVDSHAHLNAERFAGDVDAVVAAAGTAGVERLLVPGWNVASSERAMELADRHAWLDAAVGIHPHDAAKVTEAGWGRIEAWAGHDRVVAIGETGLDYDRVFSPVDAQLANLRRHLALARETGKPLVLHCRSRAGARDAQDALLSELRVAGVGRPGCGGAMDRRPPGILHSFSGPVDFAREAIGLGLAVSFSGLVFRRGEEPSTEVARLVPVDRLLVETDAPFLLPPGAPGSRNEPVHVAITARWLADASGIPVDDLGATLVAAYDATFRQAVLPG